MFFVRWWLIPPVERNSLRASVPKRVDLGKTPSIRWCAGGVPSPNSIDTVHGRLARRGRRCLGEVTKQERTGVSDAPKWRGSHSIRGWRVFPAGRLRKREECDEMISPYVWFG